MKPIAIAFADLHLTLAAPTCRSESDWLAVQANYLDQLNCIANGLPILCAGDIFDRWNSPPELVHFALTHLPDDMLCIPGQHDLPNHRLADMHKSGYGVLVKAGKIIDLSDGKTRLVGKSGIRLAGFGWEQEIKPAQKAETGVVQIAMCHRYCWTEGKSFPDAPPSAKVTAYRKALRGYDVAIFGDNHKGFLAELDDIQVLNCGGFLRRKSDEVDYEPSVGIIYSDGTIKRKRLDTSGDQFRTQEMERPEVPVDLQAFVEELKRLGDVNVDFRAVVENHIKKHNLDQDLKETILQALETE